MVHYVSIEFKVPNQRISNLSLASFPSDLSFLNLEVHF